MIKKEEVFKIGILNKPHGVKGEVAFTFSNDVFDRADCDYLVLLLDGILVPFFIKEYRFKSDTVALVKFEGLSWNLFEGFKVIDKRHGNLGEIVGVDDSTINVLFVIEKKGKELLLPAHKEFVVGIDKERKVVHVDIPEGLLD